MNDSKSNMLKGRKNEDEYNTVDKWIQCMENGRGDQ